MDKLVDLAKQDLSLFEKCKEYINGLLESLRKSYAGLTPDSREANEVLKMADAIEELHRLWEEAALSARENYFVGNKQKNTTDEGDVKHSIRNIVKKAIANKGDIGEKYNQKKISKVPSNIAQMVFKASDGAIDISNKMVAINGDDVYHAHKRHSDEGTEASRNQIALTEEIITEIIDAIYSPDIIECLFDNANNPTQKQSFAYAKKKDGYYVVAEAVGGKKNPNIVPVMMIYIKEEKWNQFIGAGKTIGEMIFQNDPKNLAALDVVKNKKNRVTVAQFVPNGTIANTPHSSQFNTKIPQSSKNVKENSVKRSDRDLAYFNAVNNNDLERAQKLVLEAARKSGYDSPLLYHGTRSFGFTNFDLDKLDDGRSIFLTSSEKIASTYSGISGTRMIQNANNKNFSELSASELVGELNSYEEEVKGKTQEFYEYELYDSDKLNGLIKRVNNGIDSLAETVSQKIEAYADKLAEDFNEDDYKVHSQLVKLAESLKGYDYNNLSTPIYMLLHNTNVFEGNEKVANLEKNIRLMNQLRNADVSNGVIAAESMGGYWIDILSIEEARNELETKVKKGNYSLLAKLGKSLVIDGEGRLWKDIRNWSEAAYIKREDVQLERVDNEFRLVNKTTGAEIENGILSANSNSEKLSEDYLIDLMLDKANYSISILTENLHTTRDIAKWAKEKGYDSVTFKNIRDNGGQNSEVGFDETADIYVIFNPNDVKSADPVTYDDNGEIIPLSERFDSDDSDIRYSERDYPIDADIENMVKRAATTSKDSMMELSDITSEQNKAINRLVNQTNDDSYRGKHTGGKHKFSNTMIKHALKEHGDFLREGLRAQLPINETDIARHLSAIKDNKQPNNIKPTKTKQGNPSILTSYAVNGYTLYAEEIIKPLGKNKPSDLIGHTMYKAPTLSTAAFYTTSVQTQPKRQSMVLCEYNTPNSNNLSTANFVADENEHPALLNYIVQNGVAKQDARSGGLIALSSSAKNFTDKSESVEQGYVMCKKPFYITNDNRVFSNSETDVSARINELKKQGYDCFIFDKGIGDNYMVAIVSKSQIIKDKPTKKSNESYQDRASIDTSVRGLLAGALESSIDAKTPSGQIQLKKLREYKEHIEQLNELSKTLSEQRKEIHSILSVKGGRTAETQKRLVYLQGEVVKNNNRVNTLDKKLLNLEVTAPLKAVLETEKKEAAKRQKAKNNPTSLWEVGLFLSSKYVISFGINSNENGKIF